MIIQQGLKSRPLLSHRSIINVEVKESLRIKNAHLCVYLSTFLNAHAYTALFRIHSANRNSEDGGRGEEATYLAPLEESREVLALLGVLTLDFMAFRASLLSGNILGLYIHSQDTPTSPLQKKSRRRQRFKKEKEPCKMALAIRSLFD